MRTLVTKTLAYRRLVCISHQTVRLPRLRDCRISARVERDVQSLRIVRPPPLPYRRALSNKDSSSKYTYTQNTTERTFPYRQPSASANLPEYMSLIDS